MKLIRESTVKVILCTIDFSQSTRQSIAWAVSMALQLRAHVSILYTYRLNQARSGEVVAMKKIIEQEALQKFHELEKACLVNSGVSYDFSIEVGFVSDRIEDHARRNSLDFLIIDRAMKTNSNESFEELMEHIHVPMLVVP